MRIITQQGETVENVQNVLLCSTRLFKRDKTTEYEWLIEAKPSGVKLGTYKNLRTAQCVMREMEALARTCGPHSTYTMPKEETA